MVTRALKMLWLDQDLKTFYETSIFRTTEKWRFQRSIKHEAICQKQASQIGFQFLMSLC